MRTTTPPARAASRRSKVEWINRQRYTSRDQARLSIFRDIETFYNPRGHQSAIGGITPALLSAEGFVSVLAVTASFAVHS